MNPSFFAVVELRLKRQYWYKPTSSQNVGTIPTKVRNTDCHLFISLMAGDWQCRQLRHAQCKSDYNAACEEQTCKSVVYLAEFVLVLLCTLNILYL